MTDHTAQLQQQVLSAIKQRQPMTIRGHGSKSFYGRQCPTGQVLELAPHSGIVNYDPGEQVLVARTGTSLQEITTLLAQNRQMLASEPPLFNGKGSLGGMVASGLAGPRRPYAAAVRDHVLGCKLINGYGEVLRMGGEVIKNVAGFDVPRLMTGAMGTLGILLEVSMRVVPAPEQDCTLVREASPSQTVSLAQQLTAAALPLSACAWHQGRSYIRLSGSATQLSQWQQQLGGERIDNSWWQQLRDLELDFFNDPRALWRLSVPVTADITLPGDYLWDWGGGQRWLLSDQPPDAVFNATRQAGGHASLVRRGDGRVAFSPLPGPLANWHKNLKHAFDPLGLFNPGRLYKEW